MIKGDLPGKGSPFFVEKNCTKETDSCRIKSDVTIFVRRTMYEKHKFELRKAVVGSDVICNVVEPGMRTGEGYGEAL
jgi:hypothetical protein